MATKKAADSYSAWLAQACAVCKVNPEGVSVETEPNGYTWLIEAGTGTRVPVGLVPVDAFAGA